MPETTETSTAEISSRYAREATVPSVDGRPMFSLDVVGEDEAAQWPEPGGTVWWAPADTDTLGEGWTELGYTTDEPSFSLQLDDTDRHTVSWLYEQSTTLQIARAFDVPLDLLGIPVRADESVPAGSVRIESKRRTIGYPPGRRGGWTARRYRAERRRYARAHREWRRAGRPTTTSVLHLPLHLIDLKVAR